MKKSALLGCCLPKAIWLVAAWLSLVSAAGAFGQNFVYHDIVVPNGLEFQDGNEESLIPFSSRSVRYQQWYRASQFNYLNAAGGGWIYDIGFRIDQPAGYPFTATYSNLQISLSTTPLIPATLSDTFAENAGTDEMVVLTASSYTVDVIGPIYFHMHFSFDRPFFYDPTKGNLLADIRINGLAGNPPFFDGYFSTENVVVSSLYGGYDSPQASNTQLAQGLVTQFGTYQVPEPSTWAMFALGLGGIAWLQRRYRR